MDESLARAHLAVSGLPANSPFHAAQVSISFGEEIDFTSLRAAWEAIAAAEPALHATFDDAGALTVGQTPAFAWNELDWRAALPADPGAEWNAIVAADAETPIASAGQPTCRFVAIRLPNGHGHAMWSFHSALLDEDAASNALHSWLATYDSLRTGAGIPEIPTAQTVPPADPDESWKDAFADLKPTPRLVILPLPAGASALALRHSISHTYERPERAEFAEAAKAMGVDLKDFFAAIWALVIARATSSPDALIWEPFSRGTAFSRTESLVLRRHRPIQAATPADLTKSTSKASSQPPPPLDLSEVATALELPHIAPAATFAFRPRTLNDELQLAMPRWMAADAKISVKSPAPVTLRVVTGDRPLIALDYAPSALSDEAAQLLFQIYREVLIAFVSESSLDLKTFTLPAPVGIATGPEIPPAFRSLVPQGLHEIFADLAAEATEAIAIQSADSALTFSSLNGQANQFARLLRKRGIEPGTKVGVACTRSPQWIALLIGILRAGGIAVPLPVDTVAPSNDLKLLVVDSCSEEAPANERVLSLSAEAAALSAEKSRGIQTDSNPQAAALSIDGETFSHEQLVAAFQSVAASLALVPGDRVLQFAPSDSFAAIEEVFVTLLSGATLMMREDDRHATRTAFQEFLEAQGVTVLSIPPAFCSQWTHYLSELSLRIPSTVRLVVVRGAGLTPSVCKVWSSITETARLVLRHPCDKAGGFSLVADATDGLPLGLLGSPAPSATVRIIDEDGLPVPSGLSGKAEICGPHFQFTSLELTVFLSTDGFLFDRCALLETRTGTENIREALLSHSEIFDAHVENRTIDGAEQCCVWIVPKSSDHGEPHDLRERLAHRLPAPPKRIRALPRLPLNAAGGVDSTALDELIPENVAVAPASRGTDEEERLRQAISRALGGRSVGLDEKIRDCAARPQVADRLFEACSRVEPLLKRSDFDDAVSVRGLLRTARGRTVAPDTSWTPIVPLRATGAQPPLVFIHDLDGSSRPFQALAAHLGEDQPCYALTARGLADPSARHQSVEEMAGAYVEALKRFDASGPYRLVGSGFGGLVAFEIARRIGSDKVPLVILLGTRPPVARNPLAGGWKNSLRNLFGRKSAPEPSPRQRRLQESPVFQANQQAAQDYKPQAAEVPMHIFVPEVDFDPFDAVESGWQRLCAGAKFYQVPCTPAEMLDEPAVEAVAGALASLAASGTVQVED